MPLLHHDTISMGKEAQHYCALSDYEDRHDCALSMIVQAGSEGPLAEDAVPGDIAQDENRGWPLRQQGSRHLEEGW